MHPYFYDHPLRIFVPSRSRAWKGHVHLVSFCKDDILEYVGLPLTGWCNCEAYQIQHLPKIIAGTEDPLKTCPHIRRAIAFLLKHARRGDFGPITQQIAKTKHHED